MLRIEKYTCYPHKLLEEGKFYIIEYNNEPQIVYTFRRTKGELLSMVSLSHPTIYWSNVERDEWEVIKEFKSGDILTIK